MLTAKREALPKVINLLSRGGKKNIAPSGFAFNEAFYTQRGHKWVHSQSQRLFRAVAGDSEECLAQPSVTKRFVGVAYVTHLSREKKNQALEKAECPVSNYIFFLTLQISVC